jgi:serine acetyltransferase
VVETKSVVAKLILGNSVAAGIPAKVVERSISLKNQNIKDKRMRVIMDHLSMSFSQEEYPSDLRLTTCASVQGAR